MIVLLPIKLPERAQDLFRIRFIDVGQGSATLLQFPEGHTVLIDSGGSSFGGTNVGRQIIAPYLWHRGMNKIDEVIITHPDADHYNGLPFIMNHFEPDKLWVRDTVGHDPSYKEILDHATSNGINVAVAKSGQILWENQESELTCLANMRSYHAGAKGHANRNKGLVIKACSIGFCVLFPGDIHKNEEMLLVEKKTDLRADILLAAHHGSRTSGSEDFLQAVSPEVVVVSSARQRAFINMSVLDSPRSQGKQEHLLLLTAHHGTIEVESSKDNTAVFETKRFANNPLYSFKRSLKTIIDSTPQ